MSAYKFDPAKTAKLDDPRRLDDLRPDAMWAALGSPTDARVIVEIGSGTGIMSEQFALLAPSAVVYAADTQPAMLEWMSRVRSGLVEAGRLVPVLATETNVPLPDGVADIVVMVNLHHELEDAAASYRDALRLLAAGGQILVVDWAKRETPKGPPVAMRADADEIARQLRVVGFAEVRSHEGLPYHSLLTGCAPGV